LVAILAGLQTFLRFGERAAKHKDAGARFGALSKELDAVLILPPKTEDEFRSWLNDFQDRWNTLSLEAPTADSRIYASQRQKILGKNA